MSEVTTPRATDLLAVKSRVSWAAIAAGAMVALSIYMLLTMLGVALGLEAAIRGADMDLGAGAAIYSILTLLIAMFFGGWTTSRLAVGETKLEAVLYGLILWGTLFLGLVWLLGAGVRTGFGAMIGMASGAYTVAQDEARPDASSSGGLPDALRRRLESDRFVEDLKKAGMDEEQARKTQAEVNKQMDRIREDPAALPEVARDLADRPAVRQAAAQAAAGARQATWWTLLGVLTSLVTVVFGSLVGSGELLQPVPVLGVRRPTTAART